MIVPLYVIFAYRGMSLRLLSDHGIDVLLQNESADNCMSPSRESNLDEIRMLNVELQMKLSVLIDIDMGRAYIRSASLYAWNAGYNRLGNQAALVFLIGSHVACSNFAWLFARNPTISVHATCKRFGSRSTHAVG